MTYIFVCESCGSQEEIDMRPSEYTSESHICKLCGETLARDITSFCSTTKWNCGGAYVSSNN